MRYTHLYKYRPLFEKNSDGKKIISEYTKKLLFSSEIYFSSPSDFNDPFDTSVALDPSIDDPTTIDPPNFLKSDSAQQPLVKAMDYVGRKLIAERKYTPRHDFGRSGEFKVFCISKDCDNKLMWAHYATSGSGICVGFKVSMDEREKRGFILLDENSIHNDNFQFHDPAEDIAAGLSANQFRKEHSSLLNGCIASIYPVVYKKELHILPIRIFSTPNQHEYFDRILTKDMCWGYEHEWRSVLPYYDIGDGVCKVYPPVIDEIIFGYKTDKTDIQAVIAELNQLHSFPQHFFQMELNQSEHILEKKEIKMTD